MKRFFFLNVCIKYLYKYFIYKIKIARNVVSGCGEGDNNGRGIWGRGKDRVIGVQGYSFNIVNVMHTTKEYTTYSFAYPLNMVEAKRF